MPTYRITSPDGKTLRVTAPEGASMDQVLSYAKSNYKPAPQGRQVYNEQAGPPKKIAGGSVTEKGFGTLAEKPSGGLVVTPPTTPTGTFELGDPLLRGGIGGLRDLAVGVARAPIDLAPPLVAVVPGLINEAMGLPADEDIGIQAIAQFQRLAAPFADNISKTVPEIQQNSTLGDIVQGITPYAAMSALTGGGSILNTMAGGALGDALMTDPNKASTIGDSFGLPTAISTQDSPAIKRMKVAAEAGPADAIVRGASKILGTGKSALVDPIIRRIDPARVPTVEQAELAEVVRRNLPMVEQNMDIVEQANNVARTSNAIPQSSKGTQPTVADLTGDEVLLNRQRQAIQNNELDGQLLERVRQNAQVLENAPRAVAAQQGTPTLGLSDFGTQTREATLPAVLEDQDILETPARFAQDKVDDALATLQTQGRDVGDVGRTVREDLVRAEDERLRAASSQKFQESGMENVRTDQLPNLSAEMGAQKEELKGVLTPSAVKAPMREASTAAKEIEARTTPTKVQSAIIDPSTGKNFVYEKPPEGASAADLQNTRSALGGKAYEAKQAGRPDDARRYGRMADAAQADLDEMEQVLEDAAIASGDENAVAQIREGRAFKKEQKTFAGEKTKGGDVLRTRNTSGDYALADKQVLKKLFTGNKDEVNRYLNVLDRPENGDVKDAVKEGLAKLYTDNFTTGGKANPAKHKAFLDEYGQAGARVWGKDWNRVSRIGDMAQEAEKIAKTAEAALKNFNDQLTTRIAGVGSKSINPVDVYDTLSKETNPAKRTDYTKAYKLAVSRTKPRLWEEYKAMRAEDWIDSLTEQASDTQRKLGAAKGDRVISPGKFADALAEKTTKQREVVKELRVLFGDDFVKNMKTLQEASKVFERSTPNINTSGADADTIQATETFYKWARVFTGYFGPAGRTLTRVKDMTVAQQRKAAAAMLEDPKLILEIAKTLKDPRNVLKQRRFVEMLASRGILAEGDNEEPIKSKMEQQQK